MAFSARSNSAVMASINITPLIDVLLVLLVIFMLTAPVITQRTRIDLPAPGIVDDWNDEPTRATLSIRDTGDWYWNGTPVSPAQAQAQMAVLAATGANAQLVMQASDQAPYDAFARAVTIANQQGLTHFSFDDEAH